MTHTHKPQLLPKARKSTWSIPWLVCSRCGLVWLKNAATKKAIQKPCPGLEDE